MNLDPERPKAVWEPLVVVAVVAESERRDGAADIDHREAVDADTSDPAAEHGDLGDLAERGDIDAVVVVDGAAAGAVAVGAAELSSLERAGPMRLQKEKRRKERDTLYMKTFQSSQIIYPKTDEL